MDLRSEKTYRALLNAFTNLLETHRYEDITVAMLCDEAMIRRTTFYKHFSDKAEFFSFFVDNLRTELTSYGEKKAEEVRAAKAARAAAGGDEGQVEENAHIAAAEEGLAVVQALVEFMLDHERLVDNVFASSMSGMMAVMIEERVAETILERYAGAYRVGANDAVTLATVSEYAAGGIVRLLKKWWLAGHDKQAETELILRATVLTSRVLAL